MKSHYTQLASVRKANAALTSGDFRVLLADDASGVVAYGRKTAGQAAVVIVNRGNAASSGGIPVSGYIPDGVTLKAAYVVGTGSVSGPVANGLLPGSIGPNSAVVLLSGPVDLAPLAPPAGLAVSNEGRPASASPGTPFRPRLATTSIAAW